jgi:predicted alpha-1,2-mannosidase
MGFSEVRRTATVAVLTAFALVTPAHAASRSFSSSFEGTDPQPAWTNTAEQSSGVTGPAATGIPGNVTDRVVAVRASGENEDGGEVKENLVDGSDQSKWLVFEPTAWVELELADPVKVVRYALTSANDAEGRDPRDWTLQGSDDGTSWTTLDTRTNEDFSARFQTKEYSFSNDVAYRHYRLDITANHGDDIIQLAELQLSNGDTAPPPAGDMRTIVGAGPRGGYNAKSGVGWTGTRALQYAGRHTADGRGYSYNKVFDVDVRVRRSTELSYLIYPDFERDDLRYPSTYASVDLAFTDGTKLSDLHATDQHGATLSPQGQGASKTLYTNQWNLQRSRIGAVAAGKTIDRILVAYDNPDGPADFGGWIDDVNVGPAAPKPARNHPSDWAVTTRGTNSSGGFSRGNNIPATAVPHGFNFWTPVTNAGTLSWLYEYQKANNADNLPTLQAFSLSHEPSPWMGDRQTFQVMPSAASGTPDADRKARALPFRHADEIARPDYYGVRFQNGIRTQIAPTDHAALMRFSFPAGSSSLIFDNVDEKAALTIDRVKGVVTGWSDVRSGLSNGATRMFIYATFDQPIKDSGMLPDGNRPSTGYVRFDARRVNLRIATSLIGTAQAKHNLELELRSGDTIKSVRKRARRQWDAKLGRVEVQGATDDQRTTLYSNLYRLFLYPNSAHENTGSAARPRWRHAVQSSTETPDSGETTTGAPVVDGKLYVNNGFWDTYRTTWSAYSLFTPHDAAEMVDGFVQQYRDGGWIARWSSPGYANLMTGTSSDAAFADALVKGVPGLDERDTYDAAVKNATVAPPGDPWDSNVGRKGELVAPFLGYTPSRVSEGVSWALEGDINDFGIANMAGKLASETHSRDARRRLHEEREYFLSRSQNYVNLFDPAIRFFQGRDASGRWKSSPKDYDPLVWGHEHDYTETDGWNFAFHTPHDGQGLANLYGGRDALAHKLDTFFSIPETANFPGSYGGTIHEMIEARDVRMGQWGFSNQVSHHIPYMYDYAGQPAKAQAKVREALRRLYLGSEIGQGYGGDEDNGETSAWYLFSALGIYPLQVGSANYAIGSPLFKKATVHLENGRDLVVRAPNNSDRNVYVQGLKLNGRPYHRSYISHRDLARGGTLEFAMGPAPSRWATGTDDVPPSVTKGNAPAEPLRDTTGEGTATTSGGDAAALFDNDSSTVATLAGKRPWLQYQFAGSRPATFYTLTSGTADGGDPSSWVVKGSNDGHRWDVLDERRNETFRWRSQTRPFKLERRGSYASYRIEITKGGGRLGEVELLNPGKADTSPLVTDVEKVVASAGDTVPVHVTVSNYGESSASGSATASVGDWTVTPASASFGPLANGESKTLEFQVSVPAGTATGTYPVKVAVSSNLGPAKAAGSVTVIGTHVEFTPDTDAEQPWLFSSEGSQLDGEVFDGHARFTDGGTHATYRFQLPADVQGGSLTLDIGNEFLVETSTDNQTWTTALKEDGAVTDLSNREERTLDLNALRDGGRTVYVRIGDSAPADGWGGWLAHVKLDIERGG